MVVRNFRWSRVLSLTNDTGPNPPYAEETATLQEDARLFAGCACRAVGTTVDEPLSARSCAHTPGLR